MEISQETKDEARAWFMDTIIPCIRAVQEATKDTLATMGRDQVLSGRMDCPECKCKGALHYTVSGYNGHVHGQCTTDRCLEWKM